MEGINEKLKTKYTPTPWALLLHPRSLATGRYEREPGTITAAVPLAKHSHYSSTKGWTLVEVVASMLALVPHKCQETS